MGHLSPILPFNFTNIDLGLTQDRNSGDYPQLISPKGKGCKKEKDKVMAEVITAEIPCRSQ
jgi:hypothetical protein